MRGSAQDGGSTASRANVAAAVWRKVFVLTVLTSICGCPAPASSAREGEIVLEAGNSDGHDAAWEKRYYYGKKTWGIIGSGKPEEGEIWFDSFPGPSSKYRVKLHGIFEQDGSSFYRVSAGARVLGEGRFPYPKGSRDCEARGVLGHLDFGVHQINKGARIAVWGRSVYECGEKGAYTLWDKLVFKEVGTAAKE